MKVSLSEPVWFNWPDFDDTKIVQDDPQLVCAYVDNIQVQILVYTRQSLLDSIGDAELGPVWGAFVVPEWNEATQRSVEERITSIIEVLVAASADWDEALANLNVLGVVEGSKMFEIVSRDNFSPVLRVGRI